MAGAVSFLASNISSEAALGASKPTIGEQNNWSYGNKAT